MQRESLAHCFRVEFEFDGGIKVGNKTIIFNGANYIGVRCRRETVEEIQIARVILSIPPTSADVERLFSRGGRIATESGSSLLPDHVNELVTLHYWLTESEERLHNLADESAMPYAKLKAAEIYKKFVTLGLDMELHDTVVLTEDSDEEDYDDDSGVDE